MHHDNMQFAIEKEILNDLFTMQLSQQQINNTCVVVFFAKRKEANDAEKTRN